MRLYPSLNDALSPKPRPLNLMNIPDQEQKRSKIGFEHLNQSVADSTAHRSASSFIRSKTFDETVSTRSTLADENMTNDGKITNNDFSKQRFKRRGHNRPPSPLPPDEDSMRSVQSTEARSEEQSSPRDSSTINRKKKKILAPHANLNLNSSSSSTSSIRASSQSLNDDRQRFLEERDRQREERKKESGRLRRSQEIQRELDVLEEKRFELDKRHTAARQNLSKVKTVVWANFTDAHPFAC